MDLVNPLVREYLESAREDPEAFWALAADELPWFRKWDSVFEQPEPPSFKWFSGALTNLSHNCLDHHVEHGRGGHAAIVHEREDGHRETLTYAQLLHRVEVAAAALRGLGVDRGDRVGIYMPTSPEAFIAMLACARVGAIHIVVFAGFGAGALGERLALAGCKVAFCADLTWRKGKPVRLKPILDEAIASARPPVEKVVVLQRGAEAVPMTPGRDISWPDFLAGGEGEDSTPAELEANEVAYILATSGTTAKPKLAVHTVGAYQVSIHAQARWMFGLEPEDVWWSTSDIGWVVGHSYILYAPLLVGCTSIAYEGALDHPNAETFYRVIEENAVSAVFTSPTAARLLMRYGDEPASGYDLSSLERLFCAGEALNAPVWEWLQRSLLANRVPVIDHYWQTETAAPIVGNPYGISLLPIQPGSAGIPLPGIDATVVDLEGNELPVGEKGIFAIKRPFPGLTPSLWGDPERYARDYWERLPGKGWYFSGDAASIDEHGYVWFSGRADEIMNIAGHRLGTIEVETAFLRHPAVAEAGVTGRPDPVRAEVISAFVVLKAGRQPSDELRRELLDTCRKELGPVAVVGDLNFVPMLPKTRSGKIMRRVLKAITLERDPGDISTIEDEGSVEEAREAWQQMRAHVQR